MQKKQIETVDPAAVPEVIEFLNAQGALEDFKASYPELFATLQELTDKYNSTLEQADKVLRGQGVGCGPFHLKHFAVKYDAEALYNAVGRDQFLAVGGKIETQTVYDVDKGRLEAAVAQRRVPDEVIAEVRKETPTYNKPKALVLP
jgi:hypothetical protein